MLLWFIIQNENIFYKQKTFPGYFLEKKDGGTDLYEKNLWNKNR